MEYTNSSLVDCEIKSPNNSGRRTHDIDRITPHCVVGQLSAEGIGSCFPQGKEASCNYGCYYRMCFRCIGTVRNDPRCI